METNSFSFEYFFTSNNHDYLIYLPLVKSGLNIQRNFVVFVRARMISRLAITFTFLFCPTNWHTCFIKGVAIVILA